MSLIARCVLFVSSYAPLLFLFALLDSFGSTGSRICVVIGAISVGALGVLWFALRSKLQPEQVHIDGARSRDADVMAYVVSYVVPFAAATDTTDNATRTALAVFAALIAVLYVRSAVYYVYPLLLLAGVHVYEATRDGANKTKKQGWGYRKFVGKGRWDPWFSKMISATLRSPFVATPEGANNHVYMTERFTYCDPPYAFRVVVVKNKPDGTIYMRGVLNAYKKY